MRSLVWMRYGITAGYVVACFVLTMVFPYFSLLLIPVFFRRFWFWLYRLFLQDFSCFHCGKRVAMDGSWKCGGCGFVESRHCYKPCAKCRRPTVETGCPHCGHGVFL